MTQPHVADVGADLVAEVGDLVHERDARGEHRVRGVLVSSAEAGPSVTGCPVRTNGSYSRA